MVVDVSGELALEPLHALASALLVQHGLATAMTRLLPVMVPGNLALHLAFNGYVPQAVRHERALLRVCQEAVSNVIGPERASPLCEKIRDQVGGEQQRMAR